MFDGRDLSPVLIEGAPGAVRPIFHYFGYQPQAVREGNWKLFVPVSSRPDLKHVSIWWAHAPAAFDLQHRLLAAPELYDLGNDPGEKTNVAARHPEVVARLTRLVREFDAGLQRDARPMQFEPGPPPPAPGTVRTAETDIANFRYP